MRIIERIDTYLNEKWGKDVEIHSTGEYSDKSVDELCGMLKRLKGKKPFDREKYSEVMFAIRAKTGWKGGEGAIEKACGG